MTIVADTGALYAAYDRDDRHHSAVSGFLSTLDEQLVVSPLVLAELDHHLATRLGERARAEIIAELALTLRLPTFRQVLFAAAADLAARHGDLRLGLTDASTMVIASELGTLEVLTTDQRHFRAVRPERAGAAAFRLLPFDA